MLEIIKKLRQMTGAGLSDCKKAVEASNGDIEGAKLWLRQNVVSLAKKKIATREALQGIVAVHKSEKGFSMIELNSETDFVARNDMFKALAATCAKLNQGDSISDLEAMASDSGELIKDHIFNVSGIIGEKIQLSRCVFIGNTQTVYSYVHNKYESSEDSVQMGKIGVIVKTRDKIEDHIGHMLAMHISAYAPEFVTKDQVSQDILDKEKSIIESSDDFAKTPDAHKDKKIYGSLEKFKASIALDTQPWIQDNKIKVGDAIKLAGSSVELFHMFKLAS